MILQLIKIISNDLKKLLKYFSGTTIFTFYNDLSLPLAAVAFPTILDLCLKDNELFITTLIGFPALFIEIHLF